MVTVKNENGVELEVIHSTFPAGEVYVRIADTSQVTGNMYVTLQSADADSILRAIMVANAIIEVNNITYITLLSDYLPYSRQDRVCTIGESNSLKVFINMLDAVFNEVITLDVHDPRALSESSVHVKNTEVVYTTLIPYAEGLVIVSPDAGAVKRCQVAAAACKAPVVTLIKTRTPSGVSQVPQSVKDADLIQGAKQLLIVDDICDGGATFLSAAKVLRDINPTADLHLLVTHGIFSQGFEKLNEVFKSVKCVNPYYKNSNV